MIWYQIQVLISCSCRLDIVIYNWFSIDFSSIKMQAIQSTKKILLSTWKSFSPRTENLCFPKTNIHRQQPAGSGRACTELFPCFTTKYFYHWNIFMQPIVQLHTWNIFSLSLRSEIFSFSEMKYFQYRPGPGCGGEPGGERTETGPAGRGLLSPLSWNSAAVSEGWWRSAVSRLCPGSENISSVDK